MTTNRCVNRRRKRMGMIVAMIMAVVLLLPVSAYLVTGPVSAGAASEQKTNPRADYWRQVRDNTAGYSAVKGQESNELIQGTGQNWRALRNGPVARYGSALLAMTLAALTLFYIWRGQVKLAQPRTGKTVERWSARERRMHWATAILFIILMITGLSLLYGRLVLIPWLGHAGFASYAMAAKWIHNIAGPAFIVGFVAMIVSWMKENMLKKVDWQWFKAGGGIIGDAHPSAEKLNGGEKLWFWSLFVFGLGLSLSGLVLDFPNFGQQREWLQLAHLVHVVAALILIAFSLGHIYIATLGTEGALEGMVSGRVDVAWAQQHHDLWLQDLQQQGKVVEEESADSR